MKSGSFITLALELFRFTEAYMANTLLTDQDQYLLSSDLIVDFAKDLNIREVQFVEIFESYKKIVKSLSRLECLECPQFHEHVNTRDNLIMIMKEIHFDKIFSSSKKYKLNAPSKTA